MKLVEERQHSAAQRLSPWDIGLIVDRTSRFAVLVHLFKGT